MAQHMRCNPLSRKRGAILSRSCRMFLQDPGNAIASQRLTVPVDEDVLLVAGCAHASQSM